MEQISVAAYMGAKCRLAQILVAMMVYMKANRYVDLFGGLGNLFIQKPVHEIEVYNDLDSDLYCLFKQLSTGGGRSALVKRILDFSYSAEVHDKAQEILRSGLIKSGISELEYATYVWYDLLTSMNGNKTGAFRGINDKIDENKVKNRILHKLDMLERFEGVQVTNRNALDVIKEDIQNKELADRTMYFLDSPYFENNAGYSHNMVFSKEHEEYCDLVGRLGGYKMVCGYDNPVYQKILVEKYGFYKYLVKEVAKTMRIGGGDELRAREDEFVWLSYPLKGAYQL
ncbi:DNA adenine methylase [Enterocloster lavalensis]|uniref:DNA adenine methylase n=1 Tax=Enterocloster lavalensis TaxID=460384 RepID=UPI002666D8C3|nr:DNA adenine methylase [Enterocloster lavalensis]